MHFINREKELKRIKTLKASGVSALLILYGRRRIGKTRLLQQIQSETDIFFTAVQNEKPLQIRSLAEVINKHIPGFTRVNYPDWESLFLSLNERLSQHITLIIDEFPYLVKNAPELPAVIQKLYDRRDHLRFHLFLCGSSQQLMHNLVIDSSAPLYGRADEIIKLSPLSVGALMTALKCSPIQAVEEYSVWGGIPRYWELRSQKSSLEEAVTFHILDPHGILHEEPFRLFLDDTRNTIQMSSLITLVAFGVQRLSEIASRLEKPATHLNRPLQRLIDLGYLKREIPYGSSPRNAKKTLYKVSDPFIHFYYRFVVPERSLLELGHHRKVYNEIVHPGFPNYCSLLWEDLCRQAIPELYTDKLYSPGSRLWGVSASRRKQYEVDIVSASSDQKEILVGEAKWSSNTNISRLVDELDEKLSHIQILKNKHVNKVLFLKTKPKMVYKDVTIFDASDVIKALR